MIARVDLEIFPHQSFMEMLFDGFVEKSRYHSHMNGCARDIAEWNGVNVNPQGAVIKIDWRDCIRFNHFPLGGTIALQYLPSTVRKFYLTGSNMQGTVDVAGLPREMQRFHMQRNHLSADPTKGHLSVVGWTSTPVLGEAKNLFKPLVVFLSWRRPY